MGVFTRPDSPWYWLWLEAMPAGREKEKTKIRVGATPAERRTNRALAETLYHQRMNAIATRAHRLPVTLDAVTFDKYADAYELHTIPTHKGATREREILVPLRAFFGTHEVAAIDPDLVREYWTARRAAGASVATINREVDVLKAMIRDAAPKYVDKSPLAGMPRLKPGEKDTPPAVRRVLSEADEARLLAVCDPVDRALYVLGVDTLARLGDLLDLTRADRHGIDLAIRNPKGGKPYTVPLSPRAEQALDALTHADAHYFAKFRRARNPRDWRSSVRQRFERLAAACTPPIPFGLAVGGFTFHGTRKTGATRHARKGTRLDVVQRLGNWRRPDVLLRVYTEVGDADLRAAVGREVKPTTPPRSRRTSSKRRRAAS
jgi:integrase